MTIAEQQFFQLLDRYAKEHYQCFVSEMFLSTSQTEYIVCFRPATGGINSPNRYACRYLRFEAEGARQAGLNGSLSPDIMQTLDEALRSLNTPEEPA